MDIAPACFRVLLFKLLNAFVAPIVGAFLPIQVCQRRVLECEGELYSAFLAYAKL